MLNTGTSLADIAAVTRNDNDGFGGNNGWWVLIILFAIFGGWGNNRNNESRGENIVYLPTPNMNNCSGGVAAEVQRGFDTATITSKLDGLGDGICSLGYDQLAQMNGIQKSIMETSFGLQQDINQNTVAGMRNTYELGSKIDGCCCENRQGQADLKYTMATDTCAITTAIREAAQQIMQNDNTNYRQLHDENVAAQIENLKQRLAEKESMIQALNLAQSQCNQNAYLISQIRPTPQPSYTVPNPYASSGCCYNNGCCNNF